MQERLMKAWLAVGILVVVGLFMTSCLSSIFNQPPNPEITIAEGNTYGPAPLEVAFDISGSNDPNGEIISFTLW